MVEYELDANIFIESKNGPYSFDLAPGFWNFLDQQVAQRRIRASMRVYDELVENYHNDELTKWVKDRRDSGLFREPDSYVTGRYTRIIDYVMENDVYGHEHKIAFLEKADPWVIAHAEAFNLTVATCEVLVPSNSKRVKIPNVCRQFNVPWVNMYTMLKDLGLRLM